MTIAEKYAAQYLPNGEVGLADLIQAAIDEATHMMHRAAEMDAGTISILQERIRQLEAQSVAVVPEGWQLVPVEPTDAMALEAIKVSIRNPAINGVHIYRAMLAAAPAQEKDNRPANCRNRLSDEGKTYPRSGCAHCKTGGITGCPFKKENSNG